MKRAAILQLPTTLNAEQAWAEYAVMAQRYADDDALKLDLEFCKAMACAYKRWFDLFLCLEAA